VKDGGQHGRMPTPNL